MSSNNYFGFTHGGTQYGQPGSYTPAQTTYAVNPTLPYAAAAAAQRTSYEAAYSPAAAATTPSPAATAYAAGTYGVTTGQAAAAATYDYSFARTAAATGTYETPKTYYQQPVAVTYASTDYQQATQTPQPVAAATYSASYAAASQTITQTPVKQEKKPIAKFVSPITMPSVVYPPQTQAQQQQQQQQAAAPASTPGTAAYSTNFAAAAAAQHLQQQGANSIQTTTGTLKSSPQWQGFKKNYGASSGNPHFFKKLRSAPQPQQLHYCEVCKISCGGILTYKEHLEGQKHKKKEEAAKGQASSQPNRHGSSLVCELCDVTCTGADAYAAHIRGSKHQKVVKLHKILGKPIPETEPVPMRKKEEPAKAAGSGNEGEESVESGMDTIEPEVEPVGQDYIEEMKTDDGKITFNCKLCDCRFNDPNAKEMHMKGRRHRLQYKRKVDPQLVVDIKMNSRTKRMHEDRLKRQQEREFYRGRNEPWGGFPMGPPMMGRGPFGPDGPPIPPMMPMRPFDGGFFPPMRRLDSSDDRHVMFRHTNIYPKREELDAVQKIVSHNEKALKIVSDLLAGEQTPKPSQTTLTPKSDASQTAVPANTSTPIKSNGEEASADKDESKSKTEQENSFSFQPKDEQPNRILKGAMRVGSLAKNLLLTGDTTVDLVVICAEKPTRTLLFKVAELLPKQLQAVAPEDKYMVQKKAEDAAITVMDTKEPHITVTITFTSPLMREQPGVDGDGKPAVVGGSGGKPPTKDPPDVLDKAKCLDALAALRHAKWFQARAHGLQSCVIVIRILRDLRQRVPTWAPFNSWAMELLAEKVISSANAPLSVGDAFRRVMEAISCGVLLASGPGLLDPCEKEPVDALGSMTAQQREDITSSAQHALRLIAYRQIHKVLGMEMLPPFKQMFRGPRYPRKRRREGSVGEGDDQDGDGKKVRDEEVNVKQQEADK